MLQLTGIRAGYGSFQALFDVSLEVRAGEAVGVIGPNGAGKTTLMRVISGLIRPAAGRITMDGVDVLAKVGGFEIGGLVGVILGGAARRVPVALDGFIAGAAALVAATVAPASVHAMFASHRSAEPGHTRALAHLGLVPYLDLGLRLGEGTGAALFVHLARAAARVYTEMATFKSAGVDGPA